MTIDACESARYVAVPWLKLVWQRKVHETITC